MFGQGNQSASHLLNQGVKEGDLFLFFGWFRRLREDDGRLRFGTKSEDAHIIFGWLQVGEIWCEFDGRRIPKWARDHCHVRGETDDYYNVGKPLDIVFIAKRWLKLAGMRRRLPGGGIFKWFDQDLCLSRGDAPRSLWRLPSWMYPSQGRKPMSHHGKKVMERKYYGPDPESGPRSARLDVGRNLSSTSNRTRRCILNPMLQTRHTNG